jgi:hypothetical protein
MLKKILTNRYFIAGIIVFLILFFIGIFGLDVPWLEALLGSAVLAAVAIGAAMWQDVWPF